MVSAALQRAAADQTAGAWCADGVVCVAAWCADGVVCMLCVPGEELELGGSREGWLSRIIAQYPQLADGRNEDDDTRWAPHPPPPRPPSHLSLLISAP